MKLARPFQIVAATFAVLHFTACSDIQFTHVAPGKSASALLADKSVADRFNDWLTSRPITNVRFHDDLSVEVTLGITGDQVFDTLSNAGGASTNVSFIDAGPQLDSLRRDFESQFSPPVGRGRVDGPATAPAGRAQSLLPDQPPDWVRNLIRTQVVLFQNITGRIVHRANGQLENLLALHPDAMIPCRNRLGRGRHVRILEYRIAWRSIQGGGPLAWKFRNRRGSNGIGGRRSRGDRPDAAGVGRAWKGVVRRPDHAGAFCVRHVGPRRQQWQCPDK